MEVNGLLQIIVAVADNIGEIKLLQITKNGRCNNRKNDKCNMQQFMQQKSKNEIQSYQGVECTVAPISLFY